MREMSRAGALVVVGLVLGLTSVHAANKEKLQTSVKVQESTEAAAATSQKKIDSIADEAERMLTDYKLTMRQYDALSGYNNQVQKIVDGQKEELSSLESQLNQIDTTNQGMIPLLGRMVDTLEKFIQLDVPFLPKERSKRIADLKELQDRADVTISEKYRRIMEAYQVEMEYGRTIETYADDLEKDGKTRSVAFLRIGRVALMYQTLDKKETAVWDQQAKQWEVLSEEYRKPVSEGLKIALKQAPPNLIKLPVHAPEKLK